MALNPDACYQALRARDGRFDGVFFVGVATTGIYCRPICPARTPGRDRCSFFARPAQAERAGFRACLRCRPELAPGLSAVDSVPQRVRTAASLIDAGYLNNASVADLAAHLGVTARHLRRAMEDTLGVSPVQLAQTRRLALAQQLLRQSNLPIASVALAAGFGSVRRFNAVFQRQFNRAPSAVRTATRRSPPLDGIRLRLGFRPPLDDAALLQFLAARAIPGVESVGDGRYTRSVSLGEHEGWLSLSRDPRPDAHTITLQLAVSLAPVVAHVVARARRLFDLDARPDVIAEHLEGDPILGPALAARPGLRVPGAFDPFEVAVRAILGQQVSVRGATTLSGRLVERFGTALTEPHGDITHRFPTAERLSRARPATVASIGLPQARAAAIIALARAVTRGEVDLEPNADPESTIERLCRLPGIGPWTAHYVAMRALDWPDAFPASDLWVRKGLNVKTARQAEARAQHWAPWRAYGVLHLWNLEPS